MKKERDDLDIQTFVKPGKHMVIKLDEEVEYIIDAYAVADILEGKDRIKLTRVIDRTPQDISLRRIKWAIWKEGIIDYLDAK
ncbi:MAG: hypothetical protein PHF79_03180 [Candidatus Pacebacteria bacterium]|nr:hypothetical protein [Candidatus Paceibacterota bacterium]